MFTSCEPSVIVIKYYVNGTSADTLYMTQKNQCMNYTYSGNFATEFLCLQPTNFFKKIQGFIGAKCT